MNNKMWKSLKTPNALRREKEKSRRERKGEEKSRLNTWTVSGQRWRENQLRKLIDQFGCQKIDQSSSTVSTASPHVLPTCSSAAASSSPTGT